MADPRPLIEALRREHTCTASLPRYSHRHGCERRLHDGECGCPGWSCPCGADAHNARVVEALAAVEEERANADRLASALYGCGMGLHAHNPHCKCEPCRVFAAHRARRGDK